MMSNIAYELNKKNKKIEELEKKLERQRQKYEYIIKEKQRVIDHLREDAGIIKQKHENVRR